MNRPASERPLIALTGASGFVGSHIADILLGRGYKVRAAVRPSSDRRWLEGKPLDILPVDLDDDASCAAFLAGSEGLIHCAGVVMARNPETYFRVNAEATARLLRAARAAWAGREDSAVFVLVSSLAAHGPAALGAPARESQPDHPITAYGRSKLAAEEHVRADGWPFRRAILRPPSLYGPRDREFLPLLKAARRGLTARIGRHLTGLSLVDGRDAAGAAVALLEHSAAEGVFYVDDGRVGYSFEDLRQVLETVLERRIRMINLPLGLLKLISRLMGPRLATASPVLNADRLRDLESAGWVCDGSRLMETTGWRPRFDAVAGLGDTLDFCREVEWL